MKKALSVILALAVVISCFSMITVFAEDSVYGKNLLGEAESTFTGQTEVPSVWSKQGNTPTLAIADDPAEAGNKVLQSVTKRDWESPKLNVASTIKNAMEAADLTDVYVEISMRVYVQADAGTADAAKGLARMVLRSNKEFSFVTKAADGNIYKAFSSAGPQYNTWHTLTGVICVKAADLDLWTEDAYLNLCMDSIQGAADSTPVTLLVDDVSVAFTKYDGVKVTATQENTMTFIASTTTTGFIPEASGDTVAARVVLSNASDTDIYARLKPSVFHTGDSGDSWETLAAAEYQLVPAGKSVELAANVPASKEIKGKTYTYADAFIRIDVSTQAGDGAPLPKGTVLYVSGNDQAANIPNGNGYTAEVVKKADLPESVNDLWTPDAAYAEVVNGNAEDGTTGWGVFSAGSIEQVSGGANGTAHAVKYTPTSQIYGSIAFDLGAAIIQDEANGYQGAGAGEYTITFWAKTDSPAPENAKFQFILNSQEHQGAAPDEGRPVDSWLSTKQMVELTDQWKQYEVKLTVTEDYLKTVKALYDAGSAKAYQLVLRLDGSGSGSAYASKQLFPYYVDEVTITAAAGGSDQPGGGDEEVTEVQGVTVKVTSAEEGAGVYVKFDKFAGHLENGKMTVKIHNTGTSEIKLVLEARLNDSKWTTVKAGEAVTIAAGKVATLTIDCPDKMTSLVDSKEYVPFMLLKIEGAKAGDQFTVYGFTRETMETQKPVSTITTGKASLEYGTTTKACPTGDAAPVAILAIAAAACVMLGLVVAVKKKKETIG